ncbi:hypothetical protein C8R46DRAFT_915824 [Mycena filopes]|nr:hypothetical protein C8R46DRAFT_915824 [Mycena filopes]
MGLTRAEGLWFEDCGLIIQAETTIFRVSRDLLAFHSPVFKDMLSLPPPTSADMMDGCPFVLLPDTAEDVTAFLKALLHYGFFEPYPAPTTLSVLTGVLRMSHKYEVDVLRKRGLAHISAFHPSTLDEYLALSEKRSAWMNELIMKRDSACPSMAILGRQLSIEWILPIAFYRICELTSHHAILDDSMPKSDQVTLLTACRFLEGAAISTILEFLWPNPSVECISPAECENSRFASRRDAEVWRQRTPSAQSHLPFELWDSHDWVRLEVCDVCMASMKLAHGEAMVKLWDSLPGLLGLPAWADLRKMKEDALR